MKGEKIKVVKIWPNFQLRRDILVFLGFANIYYCFINGFGKIVVLIISMQKIITSATSELGKANSKDNNYD